ncbi:MAG: hypothetical protein RLZZ350_159, partial [Verrucomicrobiota bacterium]
GVRVEAEAFGESQFHIHLLDTIR